jgi:Ca2+-binding EF-hand superfamily protein
VSERILARDPTEEIRRAFQLFDDDNTGKISLRNLRRVAKEIGDRLEDDELYVSGVFVLLDQVTDVPCVQTSYD